MTVYILDLTEDLDLCRHWLKMIRDGQQEPPKRVVIVDHNSTVEQNFADYQHLYVARCRMVCVVVGSGKESETGAVLRLPETLRQDGAAVLWVSDPRGVLWSPDQGRGLPAPGWQGTSGLSELKDALSIDDVFDAVVEKARDIPYATSSPGLHTVSGSVEAEDVIAAIWHTVPRLTDSTGAPGELPLPDIESTVDEEVELVVEGSVLDRARASARNHAETADHAVLELHGWPGLLGVKDVSAAREAIVSAGRELDAFAELVGRVSDIVDAGNRTGKPAVGELTGLGLAPPADDDPTSAAEAVRTTVVRQLRAGASLGDVAAGLRNAATLLTPGGASRDSGDLTVGYPPSLSERLNDPPSPRRWVVSPVVLPLVIIATAVVTLLPGSFWLLGVALAVGWTAGVARATWSRPRDENEPVWLATVPAVAHGLAAGAGVAVARLAGSSTPVPVEVVAPASVVVLLVLLMVLLLSWNRAVREWHATTGVEDAIQAVQELGDALDKVVTEQWRLAGQRRFWSDATRAVAGVLTEVGTMLRHIAQEAGGQRTAENPLVSQVVADDLADLVLEALTPCWAALVARRGLDHLDADVDEQVRALFGAYRNHLTRQGIQEAPEFGRMGDNRELLITETLRSVPDIEAITHRSGRESMRQLCGAGDLGRLHNEITGIKVIRFAPALAQSHLTSAAADTALETRWTTGTLAAGVIRLVPVKANAVDRYWPQGEEVAQ